MLEGTRRARSKDYVVDIDQYVFTASKPASFLKNIIKLYG